MEWFVLPAPLPGGAVESDIGVAVTLAALLVAVVPLLLVLRHTFGLEHVTRLTPPLRIIEGGKELRRRAA
jgi:hypothetical protein